MGHSSKKHSHHGGTSYGSHHRAHGKGKHESHGSRGARAARPHEGFGFAPASGNPGGFGGSERTMAWGDGGRAPDVRAIGSQPNDGGIEPGQSGVSTGDKVARLVLAAFALFEAARAFYEDAPRRPQPQPVRRQRPAAPAPVRITVCTGRSCARRWDTVSPADDLRRAAAATGQALTVSTSPCMKMCEQGPVVTAASATSGERLFGNVQRREIVNIINAVSSRGR